MKLPLGLKSAPRGSPDAESDTDKLLGSLTNARKLTSEDTVVPRYAGTVRFGPSGGRIVSDVCAWLPGADAVTVTVRLAETKPAVTTKFTEA